MQCDISGLSVGGSVFSGNAVHGGGAFIPSYSSNNSGKIKIPRKSMIYTAIRHLIRFTYWVNPALDADCI